MSDGPRALHAMIADACFGATPPPDDLAAWLERHALEREDAEAILASPRRLGLYRRLVRHNVVNVVTTMLERTRGHMERIAPGSFDALLDAFMAEVGPRTHHLRDVPAELLEHALPALATDMRMPPWLADHARLELVDFSVGVAPASPAPPPLTEVTAERALVFREPITLLRLGWPVHELSDALVLAPRPLALLVYRDDAHTPRYLELTPLAGAIMERLQAGEALGASIANACKVHEIALDADVLAGAARLLGDLGERGVLLGARG